VYIGYSGNSTIVVAVDFDGDQIPGPAVLDTLPDRIEPAQRFDGLPWSASRFHVQVLRRVDYEAAGFQRVGTIEQRKGDDTVSARAYTNWQGLAWQMEFELTGQWPTDSHAVVGS
jgi:hypothetical protein